MVGHSRAWLVVVLTAVGACGDDATADAAIDEETGADAQDSSPRDEGPLDGSTDSTEDIPTDSVDDTSAEGSVETDAGALEPPPRLTVPLTAPLASGNAGNPWSVEASRRYATQSARPWMNGGFGVEEARCGLQGSIVRVTNLEDSGPGSFREAVEETEGPRIVVFEVSGVIRLRGNVDVEDPFITIAGQTAPPPGISLYHAGLIVRTHDVCIQHLRIRVGDQQWDGTPYPPGSGDQIDALGIRNNRGLPALNNVVLDNLSLSWSSDEVFAFSRENIFDVTLRDLLIAEPLNDNLHDRGTHAYCTLLASAPGLDRISFIANVMAHCIRRAPRVDDGRIAVVNNLIYNPGVYAIQLFGNDPADDLNTTIVGNAMAYPDDESLRWAGDVSGNRGTVKALVQNYYEGAPRTVRAFVQGNMPALGLPVHIDESAFQTSETPSMLLADAEVWHASIYALEAEVVERELLANAGAFPRFRDDVDARVVDDIRRRRGTFIDSQDDVGGYPSVTENRRALMPPSDPTGDDDDDGVPNIAEWLQGFTDAIE
ncbi:MAG: hypothetical protein AAF645_12760 [Myxococcota bacterium]